MAAKRVGTLVKEPRTAADPTQGQLALKVAGVGESDLAALAKR